MKLRSSKTKLTLTVRRSAIEAAKKYSQRTGKSVSAIFEDLFEKTPVGALKSEAMRAAERLLEKLEGQKGIRTRKINDKALVKKHVARKFA